jgi:Phosphate-selective porin O and P
MLKTASRVSSIAGAVCFVTLLVAHRAEAQGLTASGVVYSQFEYQLAEEANDASAFDVKRAYLDFRGSFDGGIATRVTADLYRDDNGSLNYRLKYGYFAWTPEDSPFTLKFGQIHTPWLDWEEGLWDYRMQGTMPLERGGYDTSSDLGAGVDAAWASQAFNMQLVVMNGEGYHGAEGDRHKDVAVRGSLRLLESDDGGSRGGLRLTGMAHVGARTEGGTRNRYAGMVSYKSSLLTLAGEAARVIDGEAAGSVDVKGNVFSVYGVAKVPETKWALVGRLDVTDPNVDRAEDRQTRFIGGVSYQLSQQVRILLDLDHVSYQGEPPSAAAAAKRSTLLFQTQFTF